MKKAPALTETWSFDMFAPRTASSTVKMATAWVTMKDYLGSKFGPLASSIQVEGIVEQPIPDTTTSGFDGWQIVDIRCTRPALRAFENSGL